MNRLLPDGEKSWRPIGSTLKPSGASGTESTGDSDGLSGCSRQERRTDDDYCRASDEGIEISFADGCSGVVPFAELPEVGSLSNLEDLELPDPFELVLRSRRGERVELPWDFARHYCDPSYRPRVEATAAAGRASLGERVRRLREELGMTQEQLATAAGIGRITLVRIENGAQSPRYGTLVALAKALRRQPADLFA